MGRKLFSWQRDATISNRQGFNSDSHENCQRKVKSEVYIAVACSCPKPALVNVTRRYHSPRHVVTHILGFWRLSCSHCYLQPAESEIGC